MSHAAASNLNVDLQMEAAGMASQLGDLQNAYAALAALPGAEACASELRSAIGQTSAAARLLSSAASGHLSAAEIRTLKATLSAPSVNVSSLVSQATSASAAYASGMAAQCQSIQMVEARRELDRTSHDLFGTNGQGPSMYEQYMHFAPGEKQKYEEDHRMRAELNSAFSQDAARGDVTAMYLQAHYQLAQLNDEKLHGVEENPVVGAQHRQEREAAEKRDHELHEQAVAVFRSQHGPGTTREAADASFELISAQQLQIKHPGMSMEQAMRNVQEINRVPRAAMSSAEKAEQSQTSAQGNASMVVMKHQTQVNANLISHENPKTSTTGNKGASHDSQMKAMLNAVDNDGSIMATAAVVQNSTPEHFQTEDSKNPRSSTHEALKRAFADLKKEHKIQLQDTGIVSPPLASQNSQQQIASLC